jgi:hypothetical protein
MAAFEQLFACENYVTRRLSLKLLGEILLDRTRCDIRALAHSYCYRSAEIEWLE